MKRAFEYLTVSLLLLISPAIQAQPPQTRAQDQSYTAEYYYKAKWGYADEFLRLFRKNHLPILKKQIETGRILRVKIERPRYHATEDGRWDFRVTIVFKNVAAAHDPGSEEAIIKQLYPDQETFRKEEQRRFEILLAHWDVPIVSVPLDQQ
ncbi:MAG TPA: hypothetical protein VFD58_19690 [Blastocatellia bacterium]|nr:hypothetical protein [Blastocatellia bacterium]